VAQLPGPLVDAGWLSSVLEDPAVRVVDVRWSPTGGTEDALHAYEDGHVPGAAFMDVDRDLSAAPFEGGPGRHPLPSPEAFSDSMASVGLGDDSIVVAYDDVHGSLAARLWWMLQATGHRVAVLDGGLPAWVQDGGAIERGAMTPRGRGSFSTSPWPSDRIVDADAVVSTIRTGEAPVLDVRAAERYRSPGTSPGLDRSPGPRTSTSTVASCRRGTSGPATQRRA
jgi:thiosulfate/3-mercaptopyruvate sulfurtransferase